MKASTYSWLNRVKLKRLEKFTTAQLRAQTTSMDENVIKKWMHRLPGSTYNKPQRETRLSFISPLKIRPEAV